MGRSLGVGLKIRFCRWRYIYFKNFVRHNSSAIEGVIEPEIGGKRMMRRRGDNAIFENVAGLEAEDANGLDADVLIRRSVDDGGIGIVGDGASENVRNTAACVRDANQGNFDRLESAVEIEIQAAKLTHTEFVIDPDAGVDFFSRVSASFEVVFGFEPFDLRGIFFSFGWLGRRCLL